MTIVNSYTTYIESGCTIGPDTVIQPFTFIGCDSTIGGECTIGPFAMVPAESIVPENATIAADIEMLSRTMR